MKRKSLAVALAAGTCLTVGQAAHAEKLINISGASLLENYVKAPASTNDYIDVDANGVGGVFNSGPQQLAGTGRAWIVNYRVTGSVNGFKELLLYGAPSAVTTGEAGEILGAVPNSTATNAYWTSTVPAVQYMTNGSASGGLYNALNPGGAPGRAASFADRTVSSSTSAPASITIDVSPMDVTTTWAVQYPGAAGPFLKPGQAGYGRNARVSVGRLGQTTPNAQPQNAGGLSNQLVQLSGGRNLFDPANSGAADANTVYATKLFYAPIAPIANFGTGVRQMTMSELRHLFVTGRTAKGENLVAITRDAGSGTRNAFMNSIGADPSWGAGDNVGGETNNSANDALGANFTPTNKAGSGRVLGTVRNTRLGIGYAGTETGVSGSDTWLSSGRAEIVGVRNDLYPGAPAGYVRPTIDAILDNAASGWVIGGQAVLSTIGDPLAEPTAAGGENNGQRPMANKAAAAYVNNIRRAIIAFTSVPSAPENDFSPGELAAKQFILLGALDKLHDDADPLSLIDNPGLVQNLQDWTRGNNVHALNASLYGAFGQAVAPAAGNSRAGKVPARTNAASTYSDQALVPAGTSYITENGKLLSYGGQLPLRNLIAADFNADGERTTADAADMVRAFRKRTAVGAWTPPAASGGLAALAAGMPVSTTGSAPNDYDYNSVDPGLTSIEVLGDFNGDGSFTAADVRYWADGLAADPATRNLDRRAGFTAVDNASLAAGGTLNFFATTFPAGNPKVYAAGDSRADVAGASNAVAPGWAPIGADGVIDARDIDYVHRQFNQAGIVGAADWSDLDEAARFDLSADMNADLKVDQADVAEVLTILGTRAGDVNLDGRISLADRAIVQGSIAAPPAQPGWATGDVNGDGAVNAADNALVCPADYTRQNSVDLLDIFAFLSDWFAGNPRSNFNDVSGVDLLDIFAFLNAWFAGSC